MKYFIFFCLSVIAVSCSNQDSTTENTTKDAVVKLIKDPIATIREVVDTNPVATFSKQVADELNDWKFAVNIYETKETFRYLMKMQYKELSAEDTLKIPNFGITPKIEVREGKDQYSCIVGFMDNQNAFKEYKLVSAKDDNLSVKVLHRYTTVTYEAK